MSNTFNSDRPMDAKKRSFVFLLSICQRRRDNRWTTKSRQINFRETTDRLQDTMNIQINMVTFPFNESGNTLVIETKILPPEAGKSEQAKKS